MDQNSKLFNFTPQVRDWEVRIEIGSVEGMHTGSRVQKSVCSERKTENIAYKRLQDHLGPRFLKTNEVLHFAEYKLAQSNVALCWGRTFFYWPSSNLRILGLFREISAGFEDCNMSSPVCGIFSILAYVVFMLTLLFSIFGVYLYFTILCIIFQVLPQLYYHCCITAALLQVQ